MNRKYGLGFLAACALVIAGGVAPSSGRAAEAAPFAGGVIKRGGLSVEFDAKGIMTSVEFGGRKLLGQHPGGVSTAGHKEDRWSPYVSQSATRVDVTLEERADAAVVRARGVLKPKGVGEGESAFEVVTEVSSDKIVQTAQASTPVEGLWNSFGSCLVLDPEFFAMACFRGDGEPWKLIPDQPKDRNLIMGSRIASTVEIVTEPVRLSFAFEDVKTAFFDDRAKQWRNFKLEFATPQQAKSDERGQTRYVGRYGVTIAFAENPGGAMPMEVPRRTAAPTDVPVLDLAAPERALDAPATRRRLSLDGKWSLQLLGGGKDFPQALLTYPPRAGVWKPTVVPSGPYPQDGWSGPEHAAWFTVKFIPPVGQSGDQSAILHFEEISYWCVFYLNGKKLGEHFGGYVPVRLDATQHLRPGVENTLEIFIGDDTAAFDSGRYPAGAPAAVTRAATLPDSLTAPAFCAHRGILQSAWLELLPRVHAAEVFVKTSVRRQRFEVETTVANGTELNQRVAVRHVVRDGDRVVKQIADEALLIPPRGTRTVVQSADWADPKLWDVGRPNLYHLDTTVLVGDAAVDAMSTRFGFREIWIEGPDLVLNGKKIRLREAATHIYYHPGRVTWDARYKDDPVAGARAEIEALQQANFNATRMVHRPHPRHFYDICDELGHLAISHMPFGFHIGQFQLDNPNLAANAERIVSGVVRKERNHPSIVIWEVENEGFPFGVDELSYRMADFYERGVMTPIRRLDSTRPLKSGGDGDLMGRTDIIDMHGGDWPSLDDVPLPNSNWQVLDRPSTRCYGFVDGQRWRWDRTKPLYFGEGLYWMFDDTKTRAARMIGEAVFDDPHLGDQWVRNQEQFLETGQAAYWRIGIPVWRMLGELAGYCPWAVSPGFGATLTMPDRPVISAAREMLKPERFFVKQLYRNFYAGAPASLDFCFVNDDRDAHRYQVEWQTVQGDVRAAGGAFELPLEPAGTGWKTLAFTMPKSAERGTVELTVTMKREGRTIHAETLALRNFPRPAPSAGAAAALAVVDPSGATLNALESLGVRAERAATVAEALARKPRTVVFGQDALAAETEIPLALDDFVRGGGRVLMLAQRAMKSYGPMTRPDDEQRRTRSLVFAVDAAHPLLAGLTSEDFVFWNHPEWDQAHAVALNARQKFVRGETHAVLDCDSLWFSPLQEVRYGKGLYIECALDIVRKAGHEPVAGIVWRNLLARLDSYRAPVRGPLLVLRDERLVAALRAQGVVCERVEAIPAAGTVLVANGSALRADEAGAARALLEAGGTLWLHPRAGADVDVLQTVSGLSIKTRPYTADKRAREVRRTEAGRGSVELAGISSVALYERNSVDDLWSVNGAGVAELATGGAVVLARSGAGRVVIDRLAWDAPTNLSHRQWAEHYLHALAANLLVEIDPHRYQARRVLNVDRFVSLDLRPVFNRGFRDDVADDGAGGWTDQGPQNDLSGMPTGRRTFHQVVFDIVDPAANAGASCLVLHSEAHAPNCPKASAEIPFGGKASAMFFLHTASWYGSKTHGGRPVIRYVVTYEDGKSVNVEALGDRHVRDWWTPGDTEDAKGVSLLLVSETEPDAVPRRRGLQVQEWANPRPDQPIRSVRVESADSGAIPIVLAISAFN